MFVKLFFFGGIFFLVKTFCLQFFGNGEYTHRLLQGVKVLGISQLVYLFSMLPSPPLEFSKELDNIFYKFLLSHSNDRIKRRTIIGPLNMGGTKYG